MSFWSTTKASPTLWHASGFTKLEPRFLREELPALPTLPPSLSYLTLRRAVPADAAALALFLSEWYKGFDWSLSLRIEEVELYLHDSQVVVLIALDVENRLMGSILSTPFTQGHTLMSHGANLCHVYCIEGLCIHGSLRSKGLAGAMIGMIDATVNAIFGPVVMVWSRELASKPFFSTALHHATYAYISCARAIGQMSLREVPWDEFSTLWQNNCHRFPGIVASVPSNRRGGIHIWEGVDAQGATKIAVVSDTRRITKDGTPVYEVIWCGWRINNILYVAWEGQRYRIFLESIAATYRTGLLFATSLQTGGIAKKRWEEKGPWSYGTSGVHAMYIYNYLPPSFGNCLVHAIREDL